MDALTRSTRVKTCRYAFRTAPDSQSWYPTAVAKRDGSKVKHLPVQDITHSSFARVRCPNLPIQRQKVSPMAAATELAPSNTSLPKAIVNCDILVVGAGPAGLGAALLLAKSQDWKSIVVLERRANLEIDDPSRSYVYMIDRRGYALTDAVGASEPMAEAGVLMPTSQLKIAMPDGTSTVRPLPVSTEAARNVWLPRKSFLSVFKKLATNGEAAKKVKILEGTEVVSVELAKTSSTSPKIGSSTEDLDGNPILVVARHTASGETTRFAPRLLVGADGMNSMVRTALETWAPSAQLPKDWYHTETFDSPAVGLVFTVLQLPPNPPFHTPAANGSSSSSSTVSPSSMPAAGASGSQTDSLPNPYFCKIDGVVSPPNQQLALGLLPLKDETAPRLANIIRKPEHEFWKLTTGDQVRDYLQRSFPQLDIPALLSPDQLTAIATARRGTFPKIQYLKHFTAVVPPPTPATPHTSSPPATSAAAPNQTSSKAAGVVLVGDALHTFPPDLGQGVNSALQDVTVLDGALSESGGDLAKGLPLFEARRAADVAALAQLMRWCYPWQYNQDLRGTKLWQLNVGLRMALNKLAPWAFDTHSFMLMRVPGLSYSEVLRRAHATTRNIMLLATAVVGLLLALAAKLFIA